MACESWHIELVLILISCPSPSPLRFASKPPYRFNNIQQIRYAKYIYSNKIQEPSYLYRRRWWYRNGVRRIDLKRKSDTRELKSINWFSAHIHPPKQLTNHPFPGQSTIHPPFHSHIFSTPWPTQKRRQTRKEKTNKKIQFRPNFIYARSVIEPRGWVVARPKQMATFSASLHPPGMLLIIISLYYFIERSRTKTPAATAFSSSPLAHHSEI